MTQPILLASWLMRHLLPCPFKWLTGMDCPGCGFQRALLLLLQGDWKGSFALYPGTIPLLALGLFFLIRPYMPFKANDRLATVLSCLVGTMIILTYLKKILSLSGA